MVDIDNICNFCALKNGDLLKMLRLKSAHDLKRFLALDLKLNLIKNDGLDLLFQELDVALLLTVKLDFILVLLDLFSKLSYSLCFFK